MPGVATYRMAQKVSKATAKLSKNRIKAWQWD